MADNKLVLRCAHGMPKEHVVSGGGTTCIGPFQWEMTISEANSVNDYYQEYGKFYARSAGA